MVKVETSNFIIVCRTQLQLCTHSAVFAKTIILSVQQKINCLFDDLIVAYQTIDVNLTKEDCMAVAVANVEQRKSERCYSQRAGCITASNLKSVCSATESASVANLVQRVCYQKCYKFTTAATE